MSSVGLYHIDVFLTAFTYFDAVVVDTPIMAKGHAERIREAHTLEDRLARARVFIEYLDTCWMDINDEAALDWPARSRLALELIDYLTRKVSSRANTVRVEAIPTRESQIDPTRERSFAAETKLLNLRFHRYAGRFPGVDGPRQRPWLKGIQP